MEWSRRRLWILVGAIVALLGWSSPARASGVVTTGVTVGNGVTVGGVVTLPITFPTAVQVCNADLAAGAVPTGVLTVGVCMQPG